jgi:hypothetical protein
VVRLTTGVAAALLLGSTACGSQDVPPERDASTPSPSPTGSLVLDFDSGIASGEAVSTLRNVGTGAVAVSVQATGGAEVDGAEGPDGSGAVRFPAYTGTPTASAAVVLATASLTDALDVENHDFRFGAAFELDDRSSGSTADNGDNLLQRGTFDSPGQFKIQLDHRVPSCRILGDAGEVFVKASKPVDPGVWYSVSCERTRTKVSLTLAPYDAPGEAQTWSASGVTGNVELDVLPLSIGGKVSPEGVPVASVDQFNGVVDEVYLRIR